MIAKSRVKSNQIPLLNNLNDLRVPLMTRTYRFGLTLLIPLLAFSIFYTWQSGFWAMTLLPILTLFVLVAGASKNVSYSSRAWILTTLLFGLGITELLIIGWMSDARVWLLATIFVASVFISKRAGYGFWGLAGILTAGYIFIALTGWLLPIQISNTDRMVWRIILEWLVFIIIGGGLVKSAGYWISNLADGIRKFNIEQNILEDEKKKITDQINSLDIRINELQKKEKILDATASATTSLVSIQSLNSLMTFTVDLLTQSYGFEHVAIYLMDESENWLKLSAASSEAGKNLMEQDFRLYVDDSSTVGWVAANHQTKCHIFENGDNKHDIYSGSISLHAELAVPIMISRHVLGVLDIQSSNPAIFDDFTVKAVQRLVSEVSLVYNSAHRLDSVPLLDVVEPFYKAVQCFASARADNAVYAAVLELLHTYQPSRLTFFRVDDETEEFYTVFDSINGQSSFIHQPVSSLDNPIIMSLAQSARHLAEPVWLEKDKLHNGDLPGNLNKKVFNDYTLKSVGIFPVFIREKFIGAVINMYEVPHQFSQIEKRFHRVVATLTAQTLERNTLIDETTRRIEQENILNGIRKHFRTTSDPDVILRKTAQELRHLLGAEETLVHILAAEGLESSSS